MDRTFRVIIDVVVRDDEDFQRLLKEDLRDIEDYITDEMGWCSEGFYNHKVISIKQKEE